MASAKIIFSLITCVALACSSSGRLSSNGCEENGKFKEKFFKNIDVIEKYTLVRTKGERHNVKQSDFKEALKNLSKYVSISYGQVFNYNYSYPSYEVFATDKKEWLKWYEANKCNNLKWE